MIVSPWLCTLIAAMIAGVPGLSVRDGVLLKDGARSYQLKAIAEANRRIQGKIRGGLLGQLLGNLNGLPHEMKYIAEPGNVVTYTPSLPQGAWTDDDTDFEWVYIRVMQDEDCLLLPPQRITRLWRERINKRIWCSNLYARQLMDLGIDPPLTGTAVFNPWADFNISGQFICETFGLIAPAIATAFVEDDIDGILDAGLSAIDPNSKISQIIKDVRRWHTEHPEDWLAARQLLRQTYSKYNGEMRDRNGYELNTGSTIAALLYGQGDFVKTLIAAFNFGWDADNNAATAGTILGVMKGYRWMLAQGWQIVDRYKNTTRENMPADETITSFADRLTDLAEKVITEQGGERLTSNGQIIYRIRTQKPKCIQPMERPDAQTVALREKLQSEIKESITHPTSKQQSARAAYYAICLDLADSIRTEHPQEWSQALAALSGYENVAQALFHHSPTPLGEKMREEALAAGLPKPATRQDLW
jgi:hypothetical protein